MVFAISYKELTMSKKLRNVIRDANMRNFSQYAIERYIIVEDDGDDNSKDQFVKNINERLWSCIQDVNILAKGRILPYVIVRRVYRVPNNKLRIVINNVDSTVPFNVLTESIIDISELSHLINFRTTSPQRKIMVCDDIIPGNAKMVIDKEDQLSAAVDIFLDIAMFNSYSFLNEMPHEEKVMFSNKKYKYFKESGEESYYLFSDANPPSYYSFAFSARNDGKTLDYSKYIDLWEKFIEKQYPLCVNNIPSIIDQVNCYKDVGNLDKEYFDLDYWKKYEGDLLLLRINKEPNTNLEKDKILKYFHLTEFNVGETIIVSSNDYFNPLIRKLINELVVSAFKIVL